MEEVGLQWRGEDGGGGKTVEGEGQWSGEDGEDGEGESIVEVKYSGGGRIVEMGEQQRWSMVEMGIQWKREYS